MALEILSIDLSSTVIGSVVSFMVVLISYIIYRIGIGEKSFEEVIEEQKRQSLEEELRQKSDKVKKEKKFKKTWTKKSKEKSESEIPLEPVQSMESKDVETNIEIIEPKEIKSAKQKYKSKSSALNTQSSDTKTQQRVKVDASIDEKLVTGKSKIFEESNMMQDPKQVKLVEVSKEENIQHVPLAPVHTTSQPMVTSQKKKKSAEKSSIALTSTKLLAMIKESDLEAEEIQNLIDVLLNKQKDTSGWTKINDPLALTKKNLHEKVQLLDRELQQNQDMTSKLKDLREECNALKSKLTIQEKSSVDKIARLQNDVQNLTTRTKQLQDQLATEKEKLALINKENEKKIAVSIKALEEEKARLMQKIFNFEAESRSGISKTEYETAKKAREELQKVHMLLIEQHTQLVSKEKNQHAQLTDMKAQIEKLNSQNESLSNEYLTLKNTTASLELAKKSLEEELAIQKKRSDDLEIQVKRLSSQATENKLLSELKELRLENERLVEQLAVTKERYVGDGQEILHQNGELNGKNQEISEKLLCEKDKLLKEKETLLVQLNDDLNKQKAKYILLSEEIELQKQKNNELREKNWKAMEALTNAEQKIKEMQLTIDKRTEQLEKPISSQTSVKECIKCQDVTDRLIKAEDENMKILSDYNREIEKNKVLSSEIDKLNELHKSKTSEMQKDIIEMKSCLEKCQLQTKESLQRIFPSVSVNSSLAYENWLLEFEQQAGLAVKNTTAEKEHELMQKQKHYEQALAETESTLLSLQKTAESQEIVWLERFKNKELELEQVKSQRNALVAEKEAMASTFQQLSQLKELQEKLKFLQNTLEKAETERLNLELKYDEVQKNCLNLKDQLENKEKQILELQRKSSNLENLNKEIEDLKSKLEKEKKISKDFSSQMIRLNSLVKIGQDALKTEQEMVKKLKAQIEATQVSTANGTASSTISCPVPVNESEKKVKNTAKSKKKMGRHKMTGCFG